ncbi:MAG: ABC transporter ATP-binding protein [Rhizobiales bacterium]|nr:ABC transporter ATP-binding protein [Hyphomicrobiales bacterium]
MTYFAIRNISKSFGGLKALDDVSFDVAKGTIHAVLGENGAGKTTLMNVLYGLYRPDSGGIEIDGQHVVMRSPRDAIKHGIGMIHQHFHLANALTVTENIVVGLGSPVKLLGLGAHARRIGALCEELGFEIDLTAPVWKLPMGMRQRVEILKALYRGASILVLDEPTSVLSPSEIGNFLAGLKRLRDAGTTIIFVTHKLEEVMEVAGATTVLRHGRLAAERRTTDTSTAELSRLMVGRELQPVVAKRSGEPGEVLLTCIDLAALNDRNTVALDRLSLELRAGEVLGIAGIDGNGQRELAEAITGLRPLEHGRIEIAGRDIAELSARQRLHETGIAFVPEDRQSTGLVLEHSIATNLVLRRFYLAPASRRGLLDRAKIASSGKALMERYDIRGRSAGQYAAALSGGNQQKIILAREIEAAPRILIVMQATKGLDVGAIEFVQRKILEERARGVAVLYISTELEHIMAVADRVAVMHRGRLSEALAPGEITAERMGLLMAGVSLAAA